MKRFYSVIIVLSILGGLVYWLLPNYSFLETVYPLQSDFVVLSKYDNGKSKANFSLSDSTSSLIFSCDSPIESDTTQNAYCGILFNFVPDSTQKYYNWLLVDSLIFNVNVEGTDEFIVKISTYDPDISKAYRTMIKEVSVKDGDNRVSIPLDEFYVPDYWYDSLKVDRSLNNKHWETVARLEITSGWNAKLGKSFKIEVKSVEGKGISSVSLGFLLGYFFILGMVVVGVRHKVVKRDCKK